MKVYGIPNCDTVKKALDWLKKNQLEYEFHDYKKKGITKELLHEWAKEFGWEQLLNKKGTTWRSLDAKEQQTIKDQESAIQLMIEKPSLIKRPVIEVNGKFVLGFNEEAYTTMFKTKL